MMQTDIALLFKTSADGGHAGPGSTWDYIHLIEEPLAHWMKKARPLSWVSVEPHLLDPVLFPEVGDGALLEERTVPPPRENPRDDGLGHKDGDISFSVRLDVARRVVAGETIEQIAGRCSIKVDAVLVCIRSLVLALVDAGLSEDEALCTPSRQINEIWRRRTWVAAAGHAKLESVQKGLEASLRNGSGDDVRLVWHAWLRCLYRDDLRLDRSRPASELIRFLIKFGVPRASLAITAPQQTLPLPRHLAEQKLVWRSCQPRAGAPKYRLAFVAAHIKASGGRARQVSILGLNWLMLLAGSAILTKEE